ncbi:DUF488 domain-containing protein [Rhizobium laguerreae]|uniref:DUF488 domain-containing protein n=1 Tax=Rhizobium laguerreae TaxID=1076926 RepID=UPI0014417FC6|nr:DUF488 domain-containing protein [Rhizobium laguerreae]MBY3468661.1 DUF488 domain-containing protein [Rhizobium laguerreae]NKM22036.1 DUF488 family protein [Rhizobium laguerreae]
MTNKKMEIFTIGHSANSYEVFVKRLRDAGITAIADVRSSPFSRHYPHFNRDTLKSELRMDNIAYAFLGDELGGRPKGKQFYCDGVADYEKMAETSHFKLGIDRVTTGALSYRLALMCSEHDPLDCHRCLLVGRALSERNVLVQNVLGDGRILSQKAVEDRLLKMSGRVDNDFFQTVSDRLKQAYRERSMKVAYSEKPAERASGPNAKDNAPYAS